MVIVRVATSFFKKKEREKKINLCSLHLSCFSNYMKGLIPGGPFYDALKQLLWRGVSSSSLSRNLT